MNKKSMKNRLLAGIMSAAMLGSAAVSTAVSTAVSIPAAAADNDYYEALALSLYMFDANACGTDVDSNVLTWRGNCHTYDSKAAISSAVDFDSAYKSLVDPDGDGYADVSGGLHDAGDHIKFNLTIGFGMSSLAMSEYLNPGVYEKAGAKDHLVAVLKRNAEYLMKTTYLDASGNVATICHVVADGNADHSEWKAPEEQTYERKTYWLTASNNNSAVCGEMASALAGTAYVVKDSDPDFAAECIKYAKALVDFGTNHSGNNTDGLGGFYGTDAQYQDEMAIAQAWLWINGEGSKPSYTPTANGCYNNQYYDYHLYSWDKVWSGYAAMMYKATGDSSFANEMKFELNNKGGMSTSTYNTVGANWGASRYNCALQFVALGLADGSSSSEYAQGAKWQMDFILGNNGSNKSFLIGYGDAWPTRIHHRAANPGTGNPQDNTEAKYTLYGALIGGPDASGNYEDKQNSYECTEPALDYNGCFALACAGLANLYGGSDTGAVNIVSKASEITYPFSFGSGTVTPAPTETTTEPAATTTVSESESTSTSKATTTEVPATTTQQPAQTTEKTVSITEKTNDEGKTYWTIDTTGAQSVKVTLKTNSSDTMTNGCFNPPGGWSPVDWEATPNGDGTFTVEYTVPSGQTSVDLYVWWPETATIETAVAKTNEAPATTTTSTTKATTTTTVATTTTETPSTTTGGNPAIGRTLAGDANLDGTVDIMDVILVNKALFGKATLTDQQLANVDFNGNNVPESHECLAIMKYIIKLISESEMIGA